MNVLLSGVVGSTAYNLTTHNSDMDRLGVFAAPTTAVLGLRKVKESIVTTRPDVTMHEAGKLCGLLLSGNPTVTELLWLPGDLYDTVTPQGEELIGIRSAFLSRRQVAVSYLGFARSQHRVIRNVLTDPPKLGDASGLVAKAARNMARILHQGQELYTTGHLTVRLDAETATGVWEFGAAVAAGDLGLADATLADAEKSLAGSSPLPARADEAQVQDWLLSVRSAHWDPQEVAA